MTNAVRQAFPDPEPPIPLLDIDDEDEACPLCHDLGVGCPACDGDEA